MSAVPSLICAWLVNLAKLTDVPGGLKERRVAQFANQSKKLPGDGVSVDQIVSAQPVLIPQMSGFLTSKRIWGCTTFVDHVSDYVYVHLMKYLTLGAWLVNLDKLTDVPGGLKERRVAQFANQSKNCLEMESL